MTPPLLELVQRAKANLTFHYEPKKHWAFLYTIKGEYVEFSKNQSHPVPDNLRHFYPAYSKLHAEAACIMRAVNAGLVNEHMYLVTIRLLANGETSISTPCNSCMALILSFPRIVGVYSTLNILSATDEKNWQYLETNPQLQF